MGRVISIVSQKGGVGKSTISANLAAGLVKQGNKVLVIDGDPQSDASSILGIRNMDKCKDTLAELFRMIMDDEALPEDCYIRHQGEGVDIIPSNIKLADTEVQLVNALGREFVLKQIVSKIRDRYDFILIDNRPSLGMLTINSLATSDEVFIPVEASYLPVKGLEQILRTVGKIHRQINPKLQVGGIVFNMVDIWTKEARENMSILREAYGERLRIFDTYIPFSVRVKECGKAGISIYNYDPSGKSAQAYEQFTEEVMRNVS